MLQMWSKVGRHYLLFSVQTDLLKHTLQERFTEIEPPAVHIEPDITIEIFEFVGEEYMKHEIDVAIEQTDEHVRFVRTDYELTTSLDYRKAHILAHDPVGLMHALLNLYSSYLIYHEQGLLLHSSCIIENGKAWLFAGDSGAGKSTVVTLSQPRPVLSDEATYIIIDEGNLVVHDSPFRSEFPGPCAVHECSIGGIHLLNQSPDVYRVPMTKGDTLIALMDKVFYWRHSTQETSKMISLCKKVVMSTSAYQLYFQENDSFWERIS
ncbi:hypothetical protein ACFO9Q_05080 [Paenibacillus sp. GCM10023252]|uniref:hypothetical protein n=1 Tax=Paenibacillus sp. GCM10023252 TaxID=3252649 RepID=UPI0036188D26